MAAPSTNAGGLAAALAAGRRDPRLGCGVGRALKTLDAADRTDLEAALDLDSGYTHATIARVLTARGLHVTGNTVGIHRRGSCGCHR